MIKAIIFDCFGVLVTNGLEPYVEKYHANDEAAQQSIKHLEDIANAGQISYDEFISRLAKLTSISEAEVRETLDNNETNYELLGYIKKLKYSYEIGLLSNASEDWMDDFFSKSEQELFDDKVLSFQHGLIKPDPKIFELAAKRLGVEPDECVLVDDRDSYCQGAQKAGMKTVQYVSLPELKKALARI